MNEFQYQNTNSLEWIDIDIEYEILVREILM